MFFAFNTAQALVVENVVKTRLIENHMQMHNLLIFLSILGGLGMFGILGIFYGPLVVTLFLTLCELYEARYMTRILGGKAPSEAAG
jgi:predicted PurR-regulated permease PerM